jgi:excinuclease ABC subunit A
VHNLKNVDVDIPRNALTVITGPSGSGKSSLAFDTIYAEGQRRFVESLSAYARQFLDRMDKPDVDSISGLPPAVAIEQQTFTKNPRSTVGTTTEVYDYLRLLYGRIGVVIDKDTGDVIRKDTPNSVVEELRRTAVGAKLFVLFELPQEHASIDIVREGLQSRGYSRLIFGASTEMQELEEVADLPGAGTPVFVVVDRFVVRDDDESISRITDSIEQAFTAGAGRLILRDMTSGKDRFYSSRFESAETRTVYVEPEPRLFSFNSPYGACPKCQGFGRSVGLDMGLVIPDPQLSLRRGAVHPFRGETFGFHLKQLIADAPAFGVPVDRPVHSLSDEQFALVKTGFGRYIGIDGFFQMLEEKSYKTHYRVMLSRYRGFTVCSQCNGSRLRTAARQVFVGGVNLPSVVAMTLEQARKHFEGLVLHDHENAIAGQVLVEIRRRLGLLCEIGLEYLTLDRLSHTLSGGESQRINLASSLGSSLVGTLYVLDEPSIGLHPRDTGRLLGILRRLRGLGNTVLVVEHDLDVIRTADHVVDVGPMAGELGGEVVYSGSLDQMLDSGQSLTAKYLRNEKTIVPKSSFRKGHQRSITVHGAVHHNLKGDTVRLPLGTMTCVTGVSGSGKSSLVHGVIYGGIARAFGSYGGEVGLHDRFEGLENITGVDMVDQTPIGRSSRSTPATYIKVFDLIRDVFASTQAAKQFGWKAGYFSFNVEGGRCEVCEGAGAVVIEMQFLPDLTLPCEACQGTRYRRDAKSIHYKGKSIIDVLNLTVDEAMEHFVDYPRIVNKLSILSDVGLGYLRLGQPSTHLSGGEAQRVKLAGHLDTQTEGHRLFIFDEPTTGLHVHDVARLLKAFDRLVEQGHTLLIIEHNLHVVSASDWVIDIGPEGGAMGGHVVATGTPFTLAVTDGSHTGAALADFYASHGVSYTAEKARRTKTKAGRGNA